MAIKFLREIVVSSLAAALVTAVYTHGPDLDAIREASAAPPATSAGEGEQRPEGLARFMARIASAHVGKSSPPSPIIETPAVEAASGDAEPVWPPQEKSAARRASGAAKAAAPKLIPSPAAASATETKPASDPAQEAPAAQAEAPPASYASRIADKFKDYVWNPGASVANGVSSGFSSVANKITSFVKRQPS